MKKLIAILSFLFVMQYASGQILKYDVVKGDKKLGNMTVERVLDEEGVRYKIDSKVVFKLLFSFTVDYKSSSEYKYGMLINEKTDSKLNGSSQKKSTIWFDGKKYTLDLDGTQISLSELKIEYSVGTIYYQEPKDNQKVFSPQFGRFLQFQKVADHQYELESPDGVNLYTYLNGICTEVKVSRDFAKFYFKMTPESVIAVKDKVISAGGATVD